MRKDTSNATHLGVGAGVPASVHPELEDIVAIVLVLHGVAALPPGQGGQQHQHQQQGPALQHHWAAYTLHWAGGDHADNGDNAVSTDNTDIADSADNTDNFYNTDILDNSDIFHNSDFNSGSFAILAMFLTRLL